MTLLDSEQFILRAMASGKTLEENFKYNVFFDPASKSYRQHRYLGLYSNRAIVGIGEVYNIVKADYEFKTDKLLLFKSLRTLDNAERDRIKNIIIDTKNKGICDASKDRNFFLVHKFFRTDFKKETSHPLLRCKYFNLRDLICDEIGAIDVIAQKLADLTW